MAVVVKRTGGAFDLALDPEMKDLRVGIVDESRTAASRELVSAITENRTLRLAGA